MALNKNKIKANKNQFIFLYFSKRWWKQIDLDYIPEGIALY